MRPTWEDVASHSASVKAMMGLRLGEAVGTRHEAMHARIEANEARQDGKRRRPIGGPATRSTEWGCWACRTRAIEALKVDGTPVPDQCPRASARHAITECRAVAVEKRRGIDESVATLRKEPQTK